MRRQLALGFRDECPADSSPQEKAELKPAVDAVQEIADQLRPEVLAFLKQAARPVGIYELRAQFGHAALDSVADPLANPVNRILKQLRDAGEVVCREFDRGEPQFSLAESDSPEALDAADIKGNEMAKRQLLVAAAGNHSVALDGPESEVAQFQCLLDAFELARSETFEILITVVEPACRERESKLPGTSTADIRRAIGEMLSLEPPRGLDPLAKTLLDQATREKVVTASCQETVIRVANTIAALDQSDTIKPSHMAEAINYAPRPVEPPVEASAVGEHEEAAAAAVVTREPQGRGGMDSLAQHHRPPSLVRPDRQITFDGQPHWEWPEPRHDRDTISVDRIRDDIDGPSHRFVIKRGDTVEVFFSRDKLEMGEVVGISHANQEVSVLFDGAKNGIWFAVGQLYPAPPQDELARRSPLPEIVKPAEQAPQVGLDESDRVQSKPYSLEAFREYRKRYEAGETSLDDHRREFARVQATREAFIANLKSTYDAQRLKILASRFGCFHAKQNNKQQNAEHVYRVIAQSFTLGGSVQYNPMSETLEEAAARQVESITEDQWQQHLTERADKQRTEQKALSDPETLPEFRLFVREKGVEALSNEQRIRFDELLADESRATRQAKRSAETVTQIESEGAADLQMTIKEGWHDRRQCKLWIVQLSDRVERATYNELNRKAKMLGGWYSSFKKSDAGFQFMSEEHAQRFAGLLDQDANRSDVLADRKSRKMESAAERLVGVAESLESQAAETLSADDTKLKNTVRRAEMAAGMRGQAYANQAMAGTLRSIAAGLDAVEAKYLDGVRAATQVSTMISLLRRGKTKRNQALLAEKSELGVWERHHESEALSNRPLAIEDAAFVEFPYPSVNRHQLSDLVEKAKGKNGLKQRSQRMQSHLITDRECHYVDFIDGRDIEFLTEYLTLCRDAGLETRWIDSGLEDYKRLLAANIHTPQELRCALRELVPHLRKKREDDPVQKAEQQLIGRNIPGFFPTPKSIISRMLELAEIETGHCVLEPSAGKGDILDMIRENHPDVELTAIEINGTLHEVLSAKDHTVQQEDFLEHRGQYDRVVMNPPFENGADIDHVRHAFDQLAPGGRVVAIMSQGPFFRSDRKATEFREWLENLGGEHEELPEDAFKGVEAFRQTGVRTKLVVVSRPLPMPADH